MSQFRDLLKLRELKHPERPSIKEGGSNRSDKTKNNKDLYGSTMQKGFRAQNELLVDPKKKSHRRGLSIGGFTYYDNKREQMSPSPVLSM
jgi:hypothetical protein